MRLAVICVPNVLYGKRLFYKNEQENACNEQGMKPLDPMEDILTDLKITSETITAPKAAKQNTQAVCNDLIH
jgi:hypothetical protein